MTLKKDKPRSVWCVKVCVVVTQISPNQIQIAAVQQRLISLPDKDVRNQFTISKSVFLSTHINSFFFYQSRVLIARYYPNVTTNL